MQNAGAIRTKFDVASKSRPEGGHKIQKFYPPERVSGQPGSAEGDPVSPSHHQGRHLQDPGSRWPRLVSPRRAAIHVVRLWSKFLIRLQLTESTSLWGLLVCLVVVVLFFYYIINWILLRIFRKTVFLRADSVGGHLLLFKQWRPPCLFIVYHRLFSSFFSWI